MTTIRGTESMPHDVSSVVAEGGEGMEFQSTHVGYQFRMPRDPCGTSWTPPY
jgi:hypothetical protein